MPTELTEEMQKLNRIAFLESFITDNDTIDAINESVSETNIKKYSNASEMLNSVLHSGGDNDGK